MPDTGLAWRLANIVALFASVASLVAMLKPDRSSYTNFEVAIIVVIGALFTWLTISDIRDYIKKRPHRLQSDTAIRNYLYRWISQGSRVHIFSRDVSWIQDEEMKDMLENKASMNELNITVLEHIPVLDSLVQAGATVNYYSDLSYIPQSRFTIANWGRSDARVAVGHREGGVHIVEEFSAGEHPVFYVANDLVEMIMRFEERMKSCRKRK